MSVSAQDIVSQNRANLSRTFKDEAVTLLSGYVQKFGELTNANDSDRVPEKTVAVGQVLISGMKMMLNLTAPTDMAKPGAVPKVILTSQVHGRLIQYYRTDKLSV